MDIIGRFEDEYLDVSSNRATVRERLEFVAGSIVLLALASGLAYSLLGETTALALAILLSIMFAITLVSQAYWAVTGRGDYGGKKTSRVEID